MDEKKVMKLNEENFENEMESSGKPVLVDFWAPWCGPCKMISPILDELATEHGEKVKFAKVNVDDDNTIASKYKIMSIPTIILFKEGKPVDKLIGARSKNEIENLILKSL